MKEPKITDRRAAVKALTLAKKRLWNGAPDCRRTGLVFICHAVQAVARENPGLVKTCDQLRALIMHRLQGAPILSLWLIQHHNIPAFRNAPRLQATRHAWVDALIKEFS